MDSLGIDKVVVSTEPIPCNTQPSGADPTLKDILLKDCLLDHVKLANLSWDCTAETV
jgi:hypothetical protein